MIDTVCLLIPKDKLTFVDLSSYGVSGWNLHSKTEQYDKFVRNPSKKHRDSGLYYPRLTGYKRKSFSQEQNVKIEFSAPKLLFLNNLDELSDGHFMEVVEVLIERLQQMGVIVSSKVLQDAHVCSVHFSKNVELRDGYTSNYLISEMNKIDLRKSFDFTRTRYINDGQSLYAHTTAHQLVIYDKIADLGKDAKRAIDKEQTLYQKDLFHQLNKSEKPKEVLRFEIRLNHKSKMNKVLEGFGFVKNPTFKEIFSSKISQAVVKGYWSKLIRDRNLGLFSISMSNKDILQTMFLADQNLKPKKAVYLLGLFNLARDENGMRQLRTIVSKKSHDRTWYRIVNDMKIATELITKNRVRNWVTQIDNEMTSYKPIKSK
jgi:hypothetical protein